MYQIDQCDFCCSVVLVLISPPVYVCWQVTGDRAKQPQLIQHRLAQLAPPAMTKGDLREAKGLNWLFVAGKMYLPRRASLTSPAMHSG